MLNHVREIILGVVALTLIAIISSTWFTIDATERGVVLRLGALFRSAPPGLGFKIPLLDSVAKISVQTNTYHWKMNTYSSDQQSADLHASVTLHAAPDQVAELYRRFQGLEHLVKRAVDPIVKQQVKVVFGQYTAVRAIQERADLNSEIMRAITSALKHESSVVIENVQIENIQFSDAYENSVEQRMLAEVEVLKLRQNAERVKVQAQIVLTQAEAKAKAVREAAGAEADAIRLKGEAGADAIKARGAALRDNPNLRILVQAERWDGRLPTTMVPGAAIPMLNISKQ